MDEFVPAPEAYIHNLVNKRIGETKLGERVQTLTPHSWETSLKESDARFVLLGIPEDIGVRANYGVGGTHTLWEPALKAILNIQNTTALPGEKLLVAGHFDLTEMMRRAEAVPAEDLRDMVSEIDEMVYPLIRQIVASGKIPIVIGGGHNNAYPILKGASLALGKTVHCVNLDAHSDYRAAEGRHSGNGFRYAYNDGYLAKYAMLGLHENYNAQEIQDEIVTAEHMYAAYYSDIFLRNKDAYDFVISEAVSFLTGAPVGVELDMDCITGVLSSAMTPAGVSPRQARHYMLRCAMEVKPAYLHLTEGATELRDGRKDMSTAKLAAFLVTDFMKAVR